MSLSQIQEIPSKNMILLVGPPGSGKSTFCRQVALKNMALDRPIIYVTTECGSFEAEKDLRERGLSKVETGLLNFVDAYNETVGLSVSNRPGVVQADCANLSSIDIAISKLQERIGKKGILLVFDSFTSPYLLSGQEVVRFMRLTLSKFAGEGNSVLTCFDEGSGKEQDIVAMMSLSNGVIKLETDKNKQIVKVVKHPVFGSTEIEVHTTEVLDVLLYDANIWDFSMIRRLCEVEQSRVQFAVNIFWPSFAYWSSMFWEPRRFPIMNYNVWKGFGTLVKDMMPAYPWHMRLVFRLLLPKSLSKAKDMKKMWRFFGKQMKLRRDGILEYVEDASKTDEHCIRIYENRECCGFENVGATVASSLPPMLAGACKGIECLKGLKRDWNIIETKCLGLGDPYCEFKLVSGEITQLRDSLEKNSSILEKIHERLKNRLMEYLLHEKPLVDRPTLGSDFMMAHPDITLPAMAGERYRMALRMGGAMSGKEVGERLIDAGQSENEAERRLYSLLEHCKVGKIAVNETIRMKESRESIYIKTLTRKWEEPSCYFTTGFLNGFFSAVKNQHVKETKCIAMGDAYCEWEFR